MQFTERRPVWEFFHDRLGLHFSEDFRGVCHVPDQYRNQVAQMDHVAVAVGYNSFVGRTCCMHTVIQRPEAVTRKMVRETFEYPFVTCNCNAVLALVDSTNGAALNFDLKLGFKEITRVPDGGTEGDLIVLQMLRSECRWLRSH
jgi:hypothetical protein